MDRHFILAVAIVWALSVSCLVAEAATLVGYWDFEESTGEPVVDLSGFENHGQMTGGSRGPGRVGQGLTLDGSGGVTVPNSPTLDFFPNGFTFSAWIKPTGFPDFTTIFFKTDRFNLIHQLHFQVDGRLYAGMNEPVRPPGFEGIGPPTVALNEWQYVAWTFDEQFHRLYDDGVEVFSAPYARSWVGSCLATYSCVIT